MDTDIILVDKPKGITSFDVIRRLRRELGITKIGHAGTLDPLATGLMIVGIGAGTKKLESYLKLPKTYEAVVRIGERRSTGDMEGEILESKDVTSLSLKIVSEVITGMTGVLTLPVPVYSAVKRGGQPLYKKARAGKTIEDIPIRSMEVMSGEATSLNLFVTEKGEQRARISVVWHVASGVYIRSLAEELGKRLGYPATIEDLRRTTIGDMSVADARAI
ncbi:tRNA pseudouridine(55) synthase TruB [Patescibacteria group bacterium]|nr:tRNA pseudouridine(55) synthase TruB [Patescibacteria group bacterium]